MILNIVSIKCQLMIFPLLLHFETRVLSISIHLPVQLLPWLLLCQTLMLHANSSRLMLILVCYQHTTNIMFCLTALCWILILPQRLETYITASLRDLLCLMYLIVNLYIANLPCQVMNGILYIICEKSAARPRQVRHLYLIININYHVKL